MRTLLYDVYPKREEPDGKPKSSSEEGGWDAKVKGRRQKGSENEAFESRRQEGCDDTKTASGGEESSRDSKAEESPECIRGTVSRAFIPRCPTRAGGVLTFTHPSPTLKDTLFAFRLCCF